MSATAATVPTPEELDAIERELRAIRDELEGMWQRSPSSSVADLWQRTDRAKGLVSEVRRRSEVRRAA